MPPVVYPRPSFDIPPANPQNALVILQSGHRVREHGRVAFDADEIPVIIEDRRLPDVVSVKADVVPLLSGQHRIVAVDAGRISGKKARWRKLYDRTIVHVHDFDVRLERGTQIEIGKPSSGVAASWPLIIFVRCEVEKAGTGQEGPIGAEVENVEEGVKGAHCGDIRARAEALVSLGANRARAVVPFVLRYRRQL